MVAHKQLFSVIESLCETSKRSKDLNEDRLIVTDGYVAVIDGATSSDLIDGRPGGIVAAEAVGESIEALDINATANEFVEAAAAAVVRRVGVVADPRRMRPSASVVVWSRERQEVWRVGDCHFRIDDREYPGDREVDRVAYRYRSAVVRARLALGLTTLEREQETSALQQPFMALVETQHAFMNAAGPDPLCYGAVDGGPTPERFTETISTVGAREIVLCSDGLPRPFATLAEGLAVLAELRRNDPLMAYIYHGSRPFSPHSSYFDDTTYIRLNVGCAG